MVRRALAVTALLAVLPGTAAALDYMSLAEPAILYDAPSSKGKRVWVIQRGTPVEVVVSLDQWIKVRDVAGAIAWAEKKSLSSRRTVIVTAATTDVRQAADAHAATVFVGGKDLVLELIDKSQNGWLKVRHTDGATGYVRATDVWGE